MDNENVNRVRDLRNSDRQMSVRIIAQTEIFKWHCAHHHDKGFQQAIGVHQDGP